MSDPPNVPEGECVAGEVPVAFQFHSVVHDVAPSPTYETTIVAGEIGARWEFWGSDALRE